MGRKGMKGFMKSAARPSTKPEDEEAEQQATAAATPSGTAATATPAAAASKAAAGGAAAAPAAPAVESGSGGAGVDNEDDDDGAQKETKSKMLQRHKREMLAHKKAVQRMGKKSKDELAKLDAEIEARHAKELQELEAAEAAAAAAGAGGGTAVAGAVQQQAAAAANGSAAAADKASKYLKDLSVGGEEDEDDNDEAAAGVKAGKKLSKAQRRRDKAAAKDAEREARIAAELAELGPSERATEEEALQELLAPLGLAIKEIRADGHCLYRSLEDQLQQTAAAANGSSDQQQQQQQYSYQELRELAADYIRQHREQFAPFLLPEDESADPEQYYEQYCDTLETTAVWGGHLELTALSAALKRHIRVHAVGMDTISMGDDDHADKPALEVCYLRHAFGLGEHYNSTKKLLFGAGAAGVDEDEDEEDVQEEEQLEAEAGSS